MTVTRLLEKCPSKTLRVESRGGALSHVPVVQGTAPPPHGGRASGGTGAPCARVPTNPRSKHAHSAAARRRGRLDSHPAPRGCLRAAAASFVRHLLLLVAGTAGLHNPPFSFLRPSVTHATLQAWFLLFCRLGRTLFSAHLQQPRHAASHRLCKGRPLAVAV